MNSHDLWNRIAKAFGLDSKKARSLDIHLSLNDLVTVDVTLIPEPSELAEFTDTLTSKRYILVEKPEHTG